MANNKTDRAFMEEASALAVDIAERGMKAVVDYMETGLRATRPNDAKQSDIERAMHVAADGLDGARKAARTKRSSEQTELESATVNFVRAVAPRIIGVAARIVTEKGNLPDDTPRENIIRIVQEVGGMVTSLLNDSVGGAPMRGPIGPSTGGPEIIRLVLDGKATSVSFRLENVGLTPANSPNDRLELITTPLIGDKRVIRTQDEIAPQTSTVVRMTVGKQVRDGTYRGYVYALWRSRPVALGEVELTVRGRPWTDETPQSGETAVPSA
jgi:hypothetical protein